MPRAAPWLLTKSGRQEIVLARERIVAPQPPLPRIRIAANRPLAASVIEAPPAAGNGPPRIVKADRFCHNAGLPPPGAMGCRGGGEVLNQHARIEQMTGGGADGPVVPPKGEPNAQDQDQVGRKKRFKITGTGKVLYAQSRKRHGMIKRTKKQIRQLRGTNVLFKTDGDNIKKYFLPNG